jgi:hypothetical protein
LDADRKSPAGGHQLTGLLVALGVDNFGSGAVLPVAALNLIDAVHLDVGQAGALQSVGTLVGLVIPAIVSRRVDA